MRSRGEKTEKGYAERDNIMFLSVKEKRIRGQYYCSFHGICALEGHYIIPLITPFLSESCMRGTILCPFQINDGKCIKGAIYCPSCEIRGETQ